MADEPLLALHQQHSAAQNKYIYFLLAVTASAVAFAVQKTDGYIITDSLIPLGIAVLLWGVSFYYGLKNILWVQASIIANYNLLQFEKGIHPQQPTDLSSHAVVVDTLRDIIDDNSDKAQFYQIWQFRLLITGAVFFLEWHVLEMLLRTPV